MQSVKYCTTYQLYKIINKNYGKLLPKNNSLETKSWSIVYVDTIRPQKILITEYVTGKRGCRKKVRNKLVTIYTLTIIDKAISQPEIMRIKDNTMHEAARAFHKEQLCRYLRPARVIHDNRSEVATKSLELIASYDIKSTPITVENSRLNIVERMHKILGNMI